MNKVAMVMAAYGAIPDVAIATIYMLLTDSGLQGFLAALAVIWSVQLVFALKSVISSTIAFRMYGKRRLVQLELEYFRKNRFPQAEPNEDAATFLARLRDSPDESIDVRLAAGSELARLQHLEAQGVLASMRAHAALDEAVDSYIC